METTEDHKPFLLGLEPATKRCFSGHKTQLSDLHRFQAKIKSNTQLDNLNSQFISQKLINPNNIKTAVYLKQSV